MALDPQEDMVFHAILGLILGLGGLLGAIIWYRSVDASSSAGTAALGAYIAPVILGVFAGIILLWAVISIILLLFRIMSH